MNETRDYLFIFLIAFWTALLILSNVIDYDLSKGGASSLGVESINDEFEHIGIKDLKDMSPGEIWESLVNTGFWVGEQIPIIKRLVPLIRIMTFQVNQELVPLWLSWLLNIFAIFTVLILYGLYRNG